MLDIELQARDSGMMIVATITANLEWTGGAADLALLCALFLLAVHLTIHSCLPSLEQSKPSVYLPCSSRSTSHPINDLSPGRTQEQTHFVHITGDE